MAGNKSVYELDDRTRRIPLPQSSPARHSRRFLFGRRWFAPQRPTVPRDAWLADIMNTETGDIE